MKKISRKQALQISKNTLLQAEKQRIPASNLTIKCINESKIIERLEQANDKETLNYIKALKNVIEVQEAAEEK